VGFYYRIVCEKIFADTIVSFVIAIDPPEKRPMPRNITIRGRYEMGESTNAETKSINIVRPVRVR
jgi:hypothetical protein